MSLRSIIIGIAIMAIVSSAIIVSNMDTIYQVSDDSDTDVVRSASINYSVGKGSPPIKGNKINEYPDSEVQKIYEALLNKYDGDSDFVQSEFAILELDELKSKQYLAGTVNDRDYVVSLSNPDIVYGSAEDVNDSINLGDLDKLGKLDEMDLEWKDIKDLDNNNELVTVKDIYLDGGTLYIAGQGDSSVFKFEYFNTYDFTIEDIRDELGLTELEEINYIYKGVKTSVMGKDAANEDVIK